MRVVTVSSHTIESTRSYLGGTFDKPGPQGNSQEKARTSSVVCQAPSEADTEIQLLA